MYAHHFILSLSLSLSLYALFSRFVYNAMVVSNKLLRPYPNLEAISTLGKHKWTSNIVHSIQGMWVNGYINIKQWNYDDLLYPLGGLSGCAIEGGKNEQIALQNQSLKPKHNKNLNMSNRNEICSTKIKT